MPDSFETIFKKIDSDVSRLHAEWSVYRQLFGTNKETVDLLNRAAPFCTRVTQDAILDDITLRICRLCDRPNTGKKRNLVLETLIDELPNEHAGISDVLRQILGELDGKIESLKSQRHKRIAHTDYEVATGKATLDNFSRQGVEEVFHLIRRFLNKINYECFEGEVAYAEPILTGDGNSLLRILRAGLRAHELSREFRTKKITAEELAEAIRKRDW